MTASLGPPPPRKHLRTERGLRVYKPGWTWGNGLAAFLNLLERTTIFSLSSGVPASPTNTLLPFPQLSHMQIGAPDSSWG